jgi:hypothetical protein
MNCDRCGRKTNHIYITENHEKVCERTCNGRWSIYPSSNLKLNWSQGSENEQKFLKEN